MSSPYNLRKNPSPRKPIHNEKSPGKPRTKQPPPDTESEEDFTEDEEENMEVSLNQSRASDTSHNASLSDRGSLNKSGEDPRRSVTPKPKKGTKSPKSKTENLTPRKPDMSKASASTEKSRSKSCSWFIFTCIFAVGLASVVFMMIPKPEEQVLQSKPPELLEIFTEKMKHVKSLFPSQSNRFWKIIRVTLRKIMVESSPDAPSVLLLVVPSGAKSSETGTCIAKHLTRTINTIFNVTTSKVINIPSDITHNNPDDEKKDLDVKIRESFETSHLHSVAVDHFEELSPHASLLFHGYCDGDNAPFKNVAIVFVLHTEYDLERLENDRTGKLVDGHLMNLWSSTAAPLDRDKIDPLIARVANNAAIVTAEKDLKC